MDRHRAAPSALSRSTAALLAAAVAAGCTSERHESSETAAEKVLTRKRHGLHAMMIAADAGRLLPFRGVLVTLDQKLVQDLLTASLPIERVIAERYRIRLDAARVKFEDGIGLVELQGRASLAQGAEAAAHADVTLFGSVDVVELDPASGVLRAGVQVIAIDARVVRVAGVSSTVAEGLVEDLGRQALDTLQPLATRVEVPVQLAGNVTLPAVGPEGGVGIAAASVPLRATVSDVRSFGGKLWVSIDVVPEASGGAR